MYLICFVLFSVNEIYHLASPASPPHYMYNPIKTLKTNAVGTINMLGKLMDKIIMLFHFLFSKAKGKGSRTRFECGVRCSS